MDESIKKEIEKIAVKKLSLQTKSDPTHSLFHLESVAENTQLISKLLDYNSKEQSLSFAAGWFHDLVRSASENPALGDEEKSSELARLLLRQLSEKKIFMTTLKERLAVSRAIEEHTFMPSWFRYKKTRDKVPSGLKDKILLSLYVADYIEANGAIVIARRSNFVAGVRLRTSPKKGGDLQLFGFKPGRDEALVVGIEGVLRLSLINPEEFYPVYLKKVVSPLFKVQREFVLGILKALGLKIADIGQILLGRKGLNGETILSFRKIQAPRTDGKFVNVVNQRGKLNDQRIKGVTKDTAYSALEAVEYFSKPFVDKLSNLIYKWQPRGKTANKWKKEMIKYQEGVWLREQFKNLRKRKENKN